MHFLPHRAAFVYSDDFTAYHLSDTHPLQQKRLLMTHRVLDAYTAFATSDSRLVAPTSATRADLLRVHSPEYLDVLQRLSAGESVPERRRYGFGTLDNPPFRGMWEASLLYAGASLDCARLVLDDVMGAFNTSGGLHHAQRDRAAGFCTVNDCALVAHFLLDHGLRRIAYVDIDAHHGDGMQALFFDDPRVLTLSMHETPESLFPRVTGFAEEVGTGAGLGFNANLPLAAGSGDSTACPAFEAAFLPLLRAFDPDVILLQVGTDGHFSDRLAHLSLTSHGWLRLAQSVIDLGKPVIALGGGGYTLSTVARLWTLLYGALSGQTFTNETPTAVRETWGIETLHDMTAPDIPENVQRRCDEYAARSVRTIRELVFTVHGL